MTKNLSRIEWIDIAKGIGILLVVLGHSFPPNNWAIAIYSFHMPLFFFISGYLFSINNKSKPFKVFLIRKSKSLLIAYFSFSILSLLYFMAKDILNIGQEINVTKSLIGIIYANNIDDWMIYNGALWFLPCLFIIEVFFYIITKNVSNHKMIFFLLIVSSIIGYLDSLYMPFRLPWSIDIAFTGIVFFGFGYLIKAKYDIFKKVNVKYLLPVIAFSLSISLLFVNKMINQNYMIDMNHNRLFNYYDFYIPAFSGIFFIVFTSIIIKKSYILTFIGKNTLLILAVHLPIIYTFSFLLVKLNILSSANQATENLALSTLTIIILIPLILIINKRFPFLIGKSRIN